MGAALKEAQASLFAPRPVDGRETVILNDRCRVRTEAGYRVVTVCGVVVAHFAVADRMGEAQAMVLLVQQGMAKQKEVAAAFGCTTRTVRRNQRRLEEGGLAALGRPRGYPKGKARLPASRRETVNGWKAEGVSVREMARRLGVTDNVWRGRRRFLVPAVPGTGAGGGGGSR